MVTAGFVIDDMVMIAVPRFSLWFSRVPGQTTWTSAAPIDAMVVVLKFRTMCVSISAVSDEESV